MLLLLIYLMAGIFGLTLGLYAGRFIMDSRLQTGVKVVIATMIRLTKKKWLRRTNPGFDIVRVQRDHRFIDLPPDERIGLVDHRAIEAASELKQRICCHFKDEINALYVFGSRVRGDYQPDSDVDIGIYLNDLNRSDLLKKELVSLSGELLIKYGLFLQPRLFGPVLSDSAAEDSESYLARTAVLYGIPV